ncbi:hypothetical protein V8E54_006715 [Elaphomyces granulatus]
MDDFKRQLVLVLTLWMKLVGVVMATDGSSGQVSMGLPTAENIDSNPLILTAVYRMGSMLPEIQILDNNDKISWTWNATNGQTGLPSSLCECLGNGSAATEVKRYEDGKKIAAFMGNAAVIVNHTPDNPGLDKKVVFGVCTTGLPNPHTFEMLPGYMFAIATGGGSANDGFWIYDTSVGVTRDPKPIQKITKLPAVHGMLWDEEWQTLWVVGTDKAADGEEKAYGLLNGYQHVGPTTIAMPLIEEPRYSYSMPTTAQCITEWGRGTPLGRYWDGPHDLVPVPGERKLLIPTELDIHALDIATKTLISGEQVVTAYLNGFVPVGNRTGVNSSSKTETLPRSDIKSISLAPEGNGLYVQPQWRDESCLGDRINVLINGTKKPTIWRPHRVYRSRWFTNIPSWPAAV